MPPRITRRDFLEGLGATAAAAGLGACKPGEGSPTAGSIDHIVLVMMENRTFDHFLGALSLEEGREDVDGLKHGMSNPDPRGGDPLEVFHSAEWCLPDPPHSWGSSHAQFDGGAMDGFARQYYQRHGDRADPRWVMGYHRREDLPITYALSDAYTTCARWFASLMTSTWPNRLYAVAGESEGMRGNDFPGSDLTFHIPTIFESLDGAGVPWAAYSQSASTLWMFETLRGRDEMLTFEHFLAHCADGRLPAVSWVEPAFGVNDDHPPVHPLLGQLFLASVHNALAASPAWDRTLLVIYYDEHGGFYDHVPPPTAPDARAAEGFDQLGFRIPALVCGPWVKPGHVSEVQLENTSPLAHIEREYDLEPLTPRTEAANDLWDLIDVDRMATGVPYEPVQLPVIELSEEEIADQCRRARHASIDQPLLERALDGVPAPAHLDRRTELDVVLREAIDHAVRLGALKIR